MRQAKKGGNLHTDIHEAEANLKNFKSLRLHPIERAQRKVYAAHMGEIDWLADTEEYIQENRVVLYDPSAEMFTLETLCLQTAERVEELGKEVESMYDIPPAAKKMHETKVAFDELKAFFDECHARFKKRFDPDSGVPKPPSESPPSLWRRLLGG